MKIKLARIDEFTTKHDLRSMIGDELIVTLKGKKVPIVLTDVSGHTVSIMRKKDNSSGKLSIDQFLKLANQN